MSLSLRFVICLCACSESTLNTIYNTWCSRWRKYGLIIYKTMVSQCWQLAKFQLPSPGNGQQYRSWCCSVTRPQETREAFWLVSTVKLQGELTPFAKHEILKRLPWQLSYCTYCLRLQCWRSADSFQPWPRVRCLLYPVFDGCLPIVNCSGIDERMVDTCSTSVFRHSQSTCTP